MHMLNPCARIQKKVFWKMIDGPFFGSPLKIKMEHTLHSIEKEHYLNQTCIFWVRAVNFQGCTFD